MQEPVKDKKADKVHKPAAAPSLKRAVNDLTCSESQIEDILSDGESTEPIGRGIHQKRQPKSPL